MATNTINENVEQAILDFGTIKQAIVNKGVSVPSGTPTSQYGNKISSIPTGADVSNVTATAGDVDTGKVFVDSTGTEVTGISTYKSDYTALNTLVTATTATNADVDYGKTYVKSDGTQGTGSSTYKADYTALNTLVSGTTATAGDVDSGKLFVKADGTQGTGSSTYKADYTALNTLVGQTTAVAEDVAQGKVFVNSSGVQTTGTASGGGGIQDLINMIERPSNTTITVPDGVTTIGYRAFSQFHGLTGITLPNTITSILQYGFYDDMNLTTINFNDGLTFIGARAFEGVGLTTITLPSTLTNFGNPEYSGGTSGGVFRYCLSLTTVTFLSKPNTTYFKSDTFQDCTNLTTIRVPWAQGEVSFAPWGATNASVIYNYTP